MEKVAQKQDKLSPNYHFPSLCCSLRNIRTTSIRFMLRGGTIRDEFIFLKRVQFRLQQYLYSVLY